LGTETTKRFGDYHLVEKIATGGMSEVWKARAYGLAGFEKTLVIKKILPKLRRDDEFVRLFIDEARIAVQLQHANIVQVFDLGEVDKTYYMAMEYVNGMDLARLFGRARDVGPFPTNLLLYIVGEVLKALQFAHTRVGENGDPLHIVHCDMSPHNVLVSFSGEVKITDFGISRATFQSQSLHETIRGKYAYMSPEQTRNAKLDARSDLFSLGVVIWEILTGRRLFKASSSEETVERVRSGDVPSPRVYRPELSEGLESFVMRALSRHPEARYSSASEMLKALVDLMAAEGVRASNHDLARFITEFRDGVDSGGPVIFGRTGARASTSSVVVLSCQPSPSDPSRKKTWPPPARVMARVDRAITRAGGTVWERGRGAILAVWVVEDSIAEAIHAAADGAIAASMDILSDGFELTGGIVPGRCKLFSDTKRPPSGWELAGPFYVARWLMNLAAGGGGLLVTESCKDALAEHGPSAIGRIPLTDERYIRLHRLTVA